jgi:glutathione S-transferase
MGGTKFTGRKRLRSMRYREIVCIMARPVDPRARLRQCGIVKEIQMKLYFAAPSPFVRKCLVCAHELRLRDQLELVPATPHPVNRDQSVVAQNPLGKIPTLITADGDVLYDSRVICEYLNDLAHGNMIPAPGPARWRVLVEQALADGIMDAAVLTRYETTVRPESMRWDAWARGQMEKVSCGLAEIEKRAGAFGDRVDLGMIAIGCALGYLDLRFGSLGWQEKLPKTAAWFDRFGLRDSMTSTRVPATCEQR